ncbi:LysR family transcriptional regulator [Dyella flava]|uniref:LysR family transcriptional regulator n=1 Tax=Dyella flava TaxID=1920170 RepID=A0ABS2JYX2_9GAMM|nr:LysR family transcriptional regulator [Dyella flava]MBM7124081.1 LysR family transcriptional regulator [Dyella flava]GLQ49206.1 LysR family transcriptional regulator [Dyella flava]
MDYFAAMHAFVRAVELGSFSKAAEEDGLKVSTVSRYVTSLEADLGAALFNRSTRRLHLTEVGRHFYEHASRILADLSEARLATTALNAQPQGLLRINIPVAFGRKHVFRHLPDFLAEYPAIRIDATLTDDTVDLIGSGTDVAIRIGALADSSLVAKRLAPQHRMLVASAAYLADRRPIREPKDLEDHECLSFALQPKEAWYFRPTGSTSTELNEVAIRGRVRANNSEALLDAALADLGIALLPTWITYESVAAGKLQIVLPTWEALIAPGPVRAIWGVYPPKKVVSPKVRAFLSFMESRFGEPPYWDKAISPVE